LKPFCIKANSLDFTSRAVLSQQLPEEEKWHPVAFYNKSLSLVEWNYKIHDKDTKRVEALPEESPTFSRDLDRPQEPRVLHNG